MPLSSGKISGPTILYRAGVAHNATIERETSAAVLIRTHSAWRGPSFSKIGIKDAHRPNAAPAAIQMPGERRP